MRLQTDTLFLLVEELCPPLSVSEFRPFQPQQEPVVMKNTTRTSVAIRTILTSVALAALSTGAALADRIAIVISG